MTLVVISPRALSDLIDITTYLDTAAGFAVAYRYEQRIRYKIERLAEFPGLGTPRPRLGPHVRLLVERPYLIYYQWDERVEVLRMLDGRRLITRKLIRG